MRSLVAVVVVCVAAVSGSCRRHAESPPAAAVEPAFALPVEPIVVPVQGDSGHAQLTASDRGAVLSWLETNESTVTLKFSQLSSNAWDPAMTVASSNNWFVTEADVPTVLRMSDGTLVATTYPSVDPEVEAYDLQLSYSRDEGKTWSRPFTPHHDRTKTQHGFASLFEMPDRTLGMIWLDGRDQTLKKVDPDGSMSIYFASFDAAWKQTAESSVNSRVCECCPTAAVVTADGPLVAFRDRTADEIRDIQVARLEQGKWTAATAVHADNWRIEACPVNGPALSSRGRTAAAAWFSATGDDGHAYAAFSEDAGRTWGKPIRLDDGTSLGRVDVELLDDGSAVATWLEFADQRAQFSARRVKPSGERSTPIVIAGAGDRRVRGYPRLARAGGDLIFAWTESGDGPGPQEVKTAVATIR
jgi:hypothetical protein